MNRSNMKTAQGNKSNPAIGSTIVFSSGLLARATAREVKVLMANLMMIDTELVYLDMTETDNLDLWGANQLVKTIGRIQARGQTFNISCNNVKIRHLLELLRIDELVPVLGSDYRTITSAALAA